MAGTQLFVSRNLEHCFFIYRRIFCIYVIFLLQAYCFSVFFKTTNLRIFVKQLNFLLQTLWTFIIVNIYLTFFFFRLKGIEYECRLKKVINFQRLDSDKAITEMRLWTYEYLQTLPRMEMLHLIGISISEKLACQLSSDTGMRRKSEPNSKSPLETKWRTTEEDFFFGC